MSKKLRTLERFSALSTSTENKNDKFEDSDDSSGFSSGGDDSISDTSSVNDESGDDSDIDYSVENKTEDSESFGGGSDEESETTRKRIVKKIEPNIETSDEKDARECIYNLIKKNTHHQKKQIIKILPPKKGEDDKRITRKILTKYEKVKILSDRTHQLELGAKPMVKGVSGLTSKEIAVLELNSIITYSDKNNEMLTNRALPFIINRELPNGVIEVFRLGELKILE
jgi:DNA-directed RNA polymerase subunit K/omega